MRLSQSFISSGVVPFFIIALGSCQNSTNSMTPKKAKSHKDTQIKNLNQADSLPQSQQNKTNIELPKGYVLFEKVHGDLNEDGLNDRVYIVKRTDKELVIEDKYRGKLDMNRRGILVYLSNKDKMNLIISNLNCFSSENEDGGAYFPPELSIEIDKGKLFIHYGHGRYGFWKYTFRFQNSHFALIGYDASDNNGPIINWETSINFLTKKKFVRENINKNTEDSGDEVFEEHWENIKVDELLNLSEIKDFDSLNVLE